MTIQITIVGLGQIGASAGLALAAHKDQLIRIGHDRDAAIGKKAQKMGAVDKIEYNLPAAVRKADIILLSLPLDQLHETLEIIAPDLKEGAVVMDTTPVKVAVEEWMKKLLPPQRYYIGLTPVLNPIYLHQTEVGIDAARADLFKGGLMAVSAPTGVPGEVLKLASDLVQMLGTTPLFADSAEMDGLMAAAHILPQLTAAALLATTIDQPGWREGRKLAGRAYAEATAPIVHQDEIEALKQAVQLNRENVLRLLGELINSLRDLYAGIDKSGEEAGGLLEQLEHALQGRLKWWQERSTGDWVAVEYGKQEIPKSSDMFRQMLVGTRPEKKKKE